MNKIFYNRWYTLIIVWGLGIISVVLAILGITKHAQDVNAFLNGYPQSYVDTFNATSIIAGGKENGTIAIALGLVGLILGGLIIVVGAITFFIPRKTPKTFFETSSIVLKKRFINYGIGTTMVFGVIALTISIIAIVFGYSHNLKAINEFLTFRDDFEKSVNDGSIQKQFTTFIEKMKSFKVEFGSNFFGEALTLISIKIAIDKSETLNALISNGLVSDLNAAFAFFDANPTLSQYPELNIKIITIKQITSLIDDPKYLNGTLKNIMDNDLISALSPTYNASVWIPEIKNTITNFTKLSF